jgi:hypothetical protein
VIIETFPLKCKLISYCFTNNSQIHDEISIPEAKESILRWNGKSEGLLGVWAIVPKDQKFGGKVISVKLRCYSFNCSNYGSSKLPWGDDCFARLYKFEGRLFHKNIPN